MWFMFRSFIAVLISAGVLLAQEQPSPAPAAEASPIPPPTLEALPSPSPVPSPGAPPEISPEPLARPSPVQGDVMRIESGAPLETKDIGMPDEGLTQPNALIPDQAPPPVPKSFESAQ